MDLRTVSFFKLIPETLQVRLVQDLSQAFGGNTRQNLNFHYMNSFKELILNIILVWGEQEQSNIFHSRKVHKIKMISFANSM